MHLLRVLISAFLVFMHCTSVSAVLIKSLNFCFISFWLQSARFSISLRFFFCFYPGLPRKTRVRKCKPFFVAKGGSWSQAFHAQTEKTGLRKLHCSLVTECGVKVSIAPYTFISHTKMSIFFRKVGPRIIFLKASQVRSCSKRSREITTLTESIAVLTKIDSQ